MKYKGSCHCGWVAFEVEGDLTLVMVVIPSSTKRQNQAANLVALKVQLSSDEMARIATLDRGERCTNPGFAPAWD